MSREVGPAQAAATAFMDDLGSGRVDAAYQSTAPAFRAKVSPEAFAALVARYPVLSNQTNRTFGGMRVYQQPQGLRAIIQVSASNPNNSISMTLVLIKVGGRWQVESVNLP